MKELLLMRHAKSDWNDLSLGDHERPLNDRGMRDAPRMGQALAERGVAPEVVVSSTAVRALTTAKIVAECLDVSGEEIVTTDRLYLPRPDQILSVIRGLDESIGCAMLFGHNPGFHEMAYELTRDAQLEQFPTCAVARIRLPVEFWGGVDFGDGRLIEFLYPKGL